MGSMLDAIGRILTAWADFPLLVPWWCSVRRPAEWKSSGGQVDGRIPGGGRESQTAPIMLGVVMNSFHSCPTCVKATKELTPAGPCQPMPAGPRAALYLREPSRRVRRGEGVEPAARRRSSLSEADAGAEEVAWEARPAQNRGLRAEGAAFR